MQHDDLEKSAQSLCEAPMIVTRRAAPASLAGLLVRNVAKAYGAPAVIVWSLAHVIPDHATGRDLARASFTTIAIPSAIAAFAVTVFLWQSAIRHNKPLRSAWQSATAAGTACGVFALGVSVVMVAMLSFRSRLYLDAVSSSVIGAATTAFSVTKACRRTEPSRSLVDHSAPAQPNTRLGTADRRNHS
jgi:energy-converting hydrogenase Eha subunit A